MTTARDIMHTGVTCVRAHETITDAARRMAEQGIGALPVCGDDDHLYGMLTDRDIVTRYIANGTDPKTATIGEMAQGTVYQVDADASVQQMLDVMTEHRVRRLPVIDDHRLVGIVSVADVARHLPEHAVAGFVKAICAQEAISSK